MTDAHFDRPLLAQLTAEEWGDKEYAAYGALMGLPGDKVPRAGSGHAADRTYAISINGRPTAFNRILAYLTGSGTS